jgi:predicted GNAT family acetyltransferase
MDFSLHDDADRHRFEIVVDGQVGGFAAYQVRDGAIVITHSQVDAQHRGQGVGKQLASRTLDLLRERGDRVVPLCPFFAQYIADHPEYLDLVDA